MSSSSTSTARYVPPHLRARAAAEAQAALETEQALDAIDHAWNAQAPRAQAQVARFIQAQSALRLRASAEAFQDHAGNAQAPRAQAQVAQVIPEQSNAWLAIALVLMVLALASCAEAILAQARLAVAAAVGLAVNAAIAMSLLAALRNVCARGSLL